MHPVQTEVQLRFGDFDFLHHVTNVAYFALMETARLPWFEAVRSEQPWNILIVKADCEYRQEIPAGTRSVTVRVTVEKIGTTSFTLLHEIRTPDVLHALGRTVHVVVDDDRRPCPLTADQRAVLDD